MLAKVESVSYYLDMKIYQSQSLEETKNIAREWLGLIQAKYTNLDEALVVGLSGHLGTGKTAFSKIVAAELGIKETVTSPTFVIMKIYEFDKENFSWKRLVHIDAYRLERREELEALNWEQLVADKNNLILIEWPENVGSKDFNESANLAFEIKEGKYEIKVR